MRSALIILLLCVGSIANAQSDSRDTAILQRLANTQHRVNFAVTAARLRTNINAERANRDLDTMLYREYGDMFWMYGMTGFYLTTQDILDDTLKASMREAWKYLTPYRGDTENHFLMYYSSLFLMSEVWPDLPGSEWFTGQSSQEIQKESKEYLLHWIDQVSKYGLNEFDSPRYHYYFITPALLLASYAKDREIRDRSQLLLELLIADYAIKYVKGNYVGAHSRTTEASALSASIGETGGYGEYFFEDSVSNLQPDLGYVALIGYKCPEIIRQIATSKSFPFEIFESKRARPSLRYERSDKPVAKYTYIDSAYSIGSLLGGIVQPIQQQSWKLVVHDVPSMNTVTGLHPYHSAYELARFFPEEPVFQAERIENTKAGYSSEDKWVGGSPYEAIFQDRNTLVAEYDIPERVHSQHAQLFIPKAMLWEGSPVDTLEKYDIRFFHIAGQEIGVRALYSSFVVSQESNGTRLRSTGPKSGYAMRVSAADTSLKERAKSLNLLANSSAKSLKRLRDQRQREASRVLYRSPYINSKRGSGIVTLSFGKRKRVLNFRTGQATER